MTRHRFHCPELSTGTLTLGTEEAHHAQNVLRLAVGSPITLFDGAGKTAEGTILEISRRAVVVEAANVRTHTRPAGWPLELFTAMPRTHRQQYLFEKATELGVAAVHPLTTAQSTVKPQPRAAAKWQRFCIESAKQCDAIHLPLIHPPRSFAHSLADAAAGDLNLIATIAPDASHLADALAASRPDICVRVWIGPEGGFTDQERSDARDRGLLPISLGPRILRVETAGVAVAAYLALAARRASRND